MHHALSKGFHVLGLNRSTKKSNPFNPYNWKIGYKHNLILEQLDANDHPTKTINIINEYQPHRIIHCADDGRIEIHDELENQPSIIVTPATHVYGPGQQVHKLIPKIVLSILLEKKIPLHNGDDAMQSFMHINDLTTGIFQVASQGAPGKIYPLTTNRVISICELVALICNRMNVRLEDIVTLSGNPPGKTVDGGLEKVTAHHELDWQPTIELEEGIDSVIAWANEWLPALKNYSLDLKN